MTKSISQKIAALIEREGPYCNDENDAGGETTWGITFAVARMDGYLGPMKDLPRERAASIYAKKYYIVPGFDKVAKLSDPIAEEMFDTGVNMGTSLPGPWLQRILNLMNHRGKDYPDLYVDGQIGPTTMAALRAFLDTRDKLGETVLLRALNSMQGVRYVEITERKVSQEDFVFGWFANRVEIA